MPSVSYYNKTAPFWDFIANLEEQGATHPFFAGAPNRGEPTDNNDNNERPNPWAQGWSGFPWGPFPHRGRHGHGPAPPSGPPGAEDQEMPEPGNSDGEGPAPPPFNEKSDNEDGPHHHQARHHGRHPHHHPHHGPHARGGGPCRRGRGGFGGFSGGRDHRRGGFHPYGFGPFDPLADMFQSQVFGGANGNERSTGGSEDFKPEADVFDTAEAFVVHVSLPGAKKEDVGVNWDADKSELSIAGVIYRPGDEELLKTLALDERRVGAFERKVRLGSRANPAQVDVDAIVAKMEDGVLRIEVPKLDSGYVEIKKVDIE